MRSKKAEKLKIRKSAAPALALWALLARSSIFKILGVLMAAVCAEAILFYGNMRAQGDSDVEYRTLAAAVESSHISLVFLAALGFLYFVLFWTEGRLETKSGGTMRRLRLSHRQIFRIKTAYNAACLILLFAVQIWLCIWLAETHPFSRGMFLAFYRIDFLHCLLPMAETVKWVRNALLVLAFAAEAARRAGKREYVPKVLLYLLTVNWFVSSLGGNVTDWLGILLYALVIAVNLWGIYKPERGRLTTWE